MPLRERFKKLLSSSRDNAVEASAETQALTRENDSDLVEDSLEYRVRWPKERAGRPGREVRVIGIGTGCGKLSVDKPGSRSASIFFAASPNLLASANAGDHKDNSPNQAKKPESSKLSQLSQRIAKSDRQQVFGDMIRQTLLGLQEDTPFVLFGVTFDIKNSVENSIQVLMKVKDWLDIAVAASPPASMAWSMISAGLPLLSNCCSADEAHRKAIEYATDRMNFFVGLETLLVARCSENAQSVLQQYKQGIVKLYQAILDLQLQSVMRLYEKSPWAVIARTSRDAFQYDHWNGMVKCINDQLLVVEVQVKHVRDEAVLQQFDTLRAQNNKLIDIVRSSIPILQDVRDAAASEANDRILQVFYVQDAADTDYQHFMARVDKREPGTCKWLLGHGEFNTWLQGDAGPLVSTADPGCGKSVLSKYLIEDILPDVGTVCYFFFKDQLQNKLCHALCALLHQLISSKRFLINHATAFYSRMGLGLRGSIQSLCEVLNAAINDPQTGPVVFVLDALDECDETDLEDFVAYLKLFFQKPGQINKFLLTSRPYPYLVRFFDSLVENTNYIRISGENEELVREISQDIDIVIRAKVREFVADRKFDKSIRDLLEQELMKNQQRTYLWIHLIFEDLKKRAVPADPDEIRTMISQLPKGIFQSYERILQRSESTSDIQRREVALQILLVSRRAHSLSEFNTLMKLEYLSRQNKAISAQSISLAPNFEETLRGWCGLLVSVYGGKVLCLHQTVREFLLRRRPRNNVTE